MNNDIRNLTKWLNEDQEAPLDRQALARVLAMAEQPAQHSKAKQIAECLAVLRPAVKGKFPHEQALEELVGYIAAPQPAQQEPVAWVPYLSDRADGVSGHYAIARWNPRGYREVWNLRRHAWGAYSDDVLSLEEADTLLRLIEIPTRKVETPQPAQPQQEPVAWMFQHEETGRTMCVDAQQVEWGFEKGNPRLKKIAPLYTSPPANANAGKPWRGLEPQDFDGVIKSDAFEAGAYWVNNILREKNA